MTILGALYAHANINRLLLYAFFLAPPTSHFCFKDGSQRKMGVVYLKD